MSILGWFKSLGGKHIDERVDAGNFNAMKYHEDKILEREKVLKEDPENSMAKAMLKHHEEGLEKEYIKDNKMLKSLLKKTIVERRTPLADDIQRQIDVLSEACMALAHQNFIGNYSSAESMNVIENAWRTEKAKLLYLCFDSLMATDEEVEHKIAEYKEEIKNDPS